MRTLLTTIIAGSLLIPTIAWSAPEEQTIGPMGAGPMGGMCPCCAMRGAMDGTTGTIAAILGGLLLASLIAVLVSLSLFLLRRSRPIRQPS